MADTILIKRSNTPGSVPTTASLQQGELALNIPDKLLYTVSGSEVVILNDTTNFVSSSQQILSVVNTNAIIPISVTSSFSGPLEGNKVVLTTTTSAKTTISSSIKSGIFAATEVVDPPIPMMEFSGVSVEYTAQRETAVRSGILIASWNGSSVTYTDVSNTDVGDSSDLSFNFIKADNNILLRAYSQGIGSGTWTVQFLFKMFPNLL